MSARRDTSADSSDDDGRDEDTNLKSRRLVVPVSSASSVGGSAASSNHQRSRKASPQPWSSSSDSDDMEVAMRQRILGDRGDTTKVAPRGKRSARATAVDGNAVDGLDVPVSYRPNVRFLVSFPASWENFFGPIDDAIIRRVQSDSKLLSFLGMVILVLTTIEVGVVAPIFFYAVGLDSLAEDVVWIMFVTCVVSQIPKRFIWRDRPFMARRAVAKRIDKTSSFPSRAVTAAVVYTFIGLYAYHYHLTDNHEIAWWEPLLLVVMAAWAGWSRVLTGSHYPSDCLIGFFQGALICALGTLLYTGDVVLCDSCHTRECYETSSAHVIEPGSFGHFKYLGLVIGLAASVVLYGVSTVRPLELWEKCNYVYGSLLPCVTFHVTCLCHRLNGGAALPPPNVAPWYSYLVGLTAAGSVGVLGMWTRGKKRAGWPSFVFLWCFVYTFLLLWRLYAM